LRLTDKQHQFGALNDTTEGQYNDSRFNTSSPLRLHRESIMKRRLENAGLSVDEKQMLETYVNFFTTLFKETQMEDVDEIVAAVNQATADKDGLDSEIKAVEREIILLEESILEEKIQMQSLRQLTPEEEQKLREVHRLEDEISKNEASLKNYDRKIDLMGKTIRSFRVDLL
jgi:chromosome segregation ATPase